MSKKWWIVVGVVLLLYVWAFLYVTPHMVEWFQPYVDGVRFLH